MNLLLVVSAIAGFGSAIGHSYLSERFVLAPMLAQSDANRVLKRPDMQRLMRGIWHLPSFIWSLTAGVTVWLLLAPDMFDAPARAVFCIFGVGIYASSALVNVLALRTPHIGNILLSIAAVTLWFGAHSS